jgi:hypothetical protein
MQHGLVAGVNQAMLVSRFSIVETSAQLDQPPAGPTRFPYRGPSALHGSASTLHKYVAQVSCTSQLHCQQFECRCKVGTFDFQLTSASWREARSSSHQPKPRLCCTQSSGYP